MVFSSKTKEVRQTENGPRTESIRIDPSARFCASTGEKRVLTSHQSFRGLPRSWAKLKFLVGLGLSALVPLTLSLAQSSGGNPRLPQQGSVSSRSPSSFGMLNLNAQSFLLGNVTLALHKISRDQLPLQFVDQGGTLIPEAPSTMTLLRGFALVKRRGSSSLPRTTRRERVPVSGVLVSKPGGAILRFRLRPSQASTGTASSRAWRVHQFEVPTYEAKSRNKQAARVRSVSSRALGNRGCLARKPKSEALINQGSNAHARTEKLAASVTGLATTNALELITDCDAECSQELGASQANDRILEYINDVNTIYPEQLGLTVVVTKQVRRTQASVYPSNLTDSLSLLQRFRSVGADLGDADAKHLITGKSLDEDVLGLAYVETVCRAGEFTAYGLSSRTGDLLTPVIIAHEIGHNLGASHDTVTGGIMSPRLGSPPPTAFSTFSKNEIAAYISQFGTECLTEMLPQTEFSASYSRRSLSATIALPEGYSGCTVRLKAGASKSKQKTILLERLLSPEETSISIALTNVKRVNPKGSSATKVFLLPSASCETGGELSGPLRSLTISSVRSSPSGFSEAKGWIRAVRSRLTSP